MSGITRTLTIILGLQLLLALYLNIASQGALDVPAGEKLFPSGFSEIAKVTIEETGSPALTLAKKDDKWVLPDTHDFPVAASRISQISGALFSELRTYPVATTSVAAKQFKVQDDNFERKVAFYNGDKLAATLLLGTSPGFKKVHARLAGENSIYAIKFNTFDVPAKAVEWYNKELLKLNRSDIAKVRIKDITAVNSDAGFVVEGLEEGKETNPDEMNSLLGKITGLMLVDVLGSENKPEYKTDAPVVEYSVELKSNETVQYTVSGPIEENFYVLKTSKYPFYMKFAKANFDAIKDLTKDKLIRDKSAAAAPEVGGMSVPPPGSAAGEEAVKLHSSVEEK